MTATYTRPADLAAAIKLKAADPAARYLAGGTYLLAGDKREKPASLIDIGAILPAGVERRGDLLAIGAGTTFQALADDPAAPGVLRAAALQMANRNVRNRATVGGNLGAGKTCASLVAPLLALDASVGVAVAASATAAGDAEALNEGVVPLADWLASPEGLVVDVRLALPLGRRAASFRWGRTACDLSVLTAAVAFTPSRTAVGFPAPGPAEGLRAGSADAAALILDVRVVFGGLGPRAKRFPEIEKLLEGRPLPSKAEIEAAVAPLLHPVDDHRGSAAFKRLRAAALLADALHGTEALS
jgi:putative selenate reductase FAD-binding subunit